MKRIKKRTGILAAIAALLLALGIWAGLTPPVSVSAGAANQNLSYTNTSSSGFDYTIESFNVDMKVGKNRTITVTEIICANLNYRRGIIRDFPLGNGVRYHKISSSCDNTDYAPYVQSDSVDYLSYYMGGQNASSGERTYTLTYEMTVPALSKEGLSLDVVGYGWDTEIKNVTVNVTVPDGLKEFKVYSGENGTEDNSYATYSRNGNTVTITADTLPRISSHYSDDVGNYYTAAGISLDLSFEKGALKTAADLSLLYVFLIGGALVAAAVLLKMFIFRQPQIVRAVNLEAPRKMDPLKMGYLVDSKVDGEDLGALVFWLASQDYLTIDMTKSKKDPTLIRTEKPLSPDLPDYIKNFYNGLFASGILVRVSSLANRFYQTANAVSAGVKASSGKTYTHKSRLSLAFFGILSALVLGGFAWLYSLVRVMGKFTLIGGYHYWMPIVLCFIAYFVNATISMLVVQRQYKWKLRKRVFAVCGGAMLSVIISLIGLFAPSAALGKFTPTLLVLFAAAAGCIGGFFCCREKEYSALLGDILGFKQFILMTERDKIKFMLNEDPELYYNILPYAQVLGVTDVWTEKFKGLNMKPPTYARYDAGDILFDCIVWNTMFRTMNSGMAHNFRSRPSSSGGGGNFSGSGRGGFGGGGFGGGGGRSF